MKHAARSHAVVLGFLALGTAPSAFAHEDGDDAHVAHWKTMVGIMQAGNVVGSVPATAIAGGGQPWSVTGGEAKVNLASGEVRFKVRGLVLAGGNGVGTPGAVVEVKGTLVCDTNNSAGPMAILDTPLVPLSATGDAQFSGTIGPIPAACAEPDIAFLIRGTANRWFANGAVLRRNP